MSHRYVSISISDRTSVDVTKYRGSIWYHIENKKKDKSVSLTREELRTLFDKKNKLKAAAAKVDTIKKRPREAATDDERYSRDATCSYESED